MGKKSTLGMLKRRVSNNTEGTWVRVCAMFKETILLPALLKPHSFQHLALTQLLKPFANIDISDHDQEDLTSS